MTRMRGTDSIDYWYGLATGRNGRYRDARVGCGTTDRLETPLETVASGSSGLQYKGDGNWQINWKTMANYSRGSCRLLELHLNDGTSHYANFKFK